VLEIATASWHCSARDVTRLYHRELCSFITACETAMLLLLSLLLLLLLLFAPAQYVEGFLAQKGPEGRWLKKRQLHRGL
jgi:hypothetical protein